MDFILIILSTIIIYIVYTGDAKNENRLLKSIHLLFSHLRSKINHICFLYDLPKLIKLCSNHSLPIIKEII